MLKKLMSLICILILTNNCKKRIDVISTQEPQNIISSEIIKAETEIEKKQDINEILKKQTKDMDFNEAVAAKEYYEKEKDIDMIIKTAERIAAIASDQEITSKAILDLAKLYLEKENFDKAQKYASDYQIMYPGTNEAKEANYIEIKARYKASADHDRDQTNTQKVIEVADEYEKNYKDDTQYLDEIKTMKSESYKKLLEHEICVINLYLSRYDYFGSVSALKGAKKRIEYIKEKLLNNINIEKPRVDELETKINNFLIIEEAKNKNNISQETPKQDQKNNIKDELPKN